MTLALPLLSGRWKLIVQSVLLLTSASVPCTISAQTYEYSPFYQKVAAPPVGAFHRWTPRANGVIVNIRMTNVGGVWNEGMRVDGPKGQEVIHLFLDETRSSVSFAYDLLVEPIAGTQQVRCTFKPQSAEAFPPGAHQSFPQAPLSGLLDPLIVNDGDTIAISMIPDSISPNSARNAKGKE